MMFLIIYRFKNSKKNNFRGFDDYFDYANTLKDAKTNENVIIVWHGELKE